MWEELQVVNVVAAGTLDISVDPTRRQTRSDTEYINETLKSCSSSPEDIPGYIYHVPGGQALQLFPKSRRFNAIGLKSETKVVEQVTDMCIQIGRHMDLVVSPTNVFVTNVVALTKFADTKADMTVDLVGLAKESKEWNVKGSRRDLQVVFGILPNGIRVSVYARDGYIRLTGTKSFDLLLDAWETFSPVVEKFCVPV